MAKSTKQTLAQKRNWYKYQLGGMVFSFDRNILTVEEQCFYQNMMDYRTKLLSIFDKGSIEMGLNVKNKKEINE